jgi:transposase
VGAQQAHEARVPRFRPPPFQRPKSWTTIMGRQLGSSSVVFKALAAFLGAERRRTMQVPKQTRWVGVDVSKATIDVAFARPGTRKGLHHQFPRSRDGCLACLDWVNDQIPREEGATFVMEATGAYSRELALWLKALSPGCRVSIAQPVQVHYFAKFLGRSNKTDAGDAMLLAEFGEQRRPSLFRPMSPAYVQLRALTRERSALVKASVSLGNRNETLSESTQAQEVRERMLAYHQKAVAELEEAIADLLATTPQLRQDYKRLQTVPGVGPVVAATLMGELGDLRDFPHPKALTAFVGVVPAVHDSGSSVHEPAHMTKHGSSRVRQVLYLAAMAAVRGNNPLTSSYQHLLEEGKPPMLALGAVMRKTLVLCRAILVADEDFDPNHPRNQPS